MKNLVLLLALVAPAVGISQDKTEPLSEAEKVSGKSGTLVEKQFVSVGKVKGVGVEIYIVKNLSDKTEVKGMRFSYTEPKQYATEKSAILDRDEIDGLIASLKTLQGLFLEKRDEYTEVTYSSRTSLKAGAYYAAKDGKWQGFVEVGRIGSATAFLSAEDMGKLLDLVEMAKGKM
jgi:hypothetical protein